MTDNLAVRIAELKAIQRGWFDGEGEPLFAAGLDQFVELFERHYPGNYNQPLWFPTPEGSIFLEWKLTHVSLEVDLKTMSAELCDVSDYILLDMNKPESWQTLFDALEGISTRS